MLSQYINTNKLFVKLLLGFRNYVGEDAVTKNNSVDPNKDIV